ncbi:ribosome-inactivating family protein [Streptomyces sp. NPDC058297]|uniref:ribosome-inactivating family protein n=1 Tax=Streptomyces sp. NPDC058297 TaxID=3346433 RepID=UPI0036E20CB1
MTRRVERAGRSERGPVRRRLVSVAVVVSVLAGALGVGEAVSYGTPARHGQDRSAQAQPQAQPQPQVQAQAVTDDEDFADLYTRTVANIRNAMLGEQSVRRPGAGHLIQNPDANAFQSINIGRFTEDEFILGGMVRGVFRRSDNYLLGFYVENRDASRRVFYTFTEQVGGRTRDMVPGNVYPGVRREHFGWGVNYGNLSGTTISRSRLRNAVRDIFHHDPNTSTHTLETGVEALAVALAEGARFQAIPGYIAQAIRGGRDWEVGRHADEITSWDQESQVVIQARAADPSGYGDVWQQRREHVWNGARVLLTALDLARRLYLIKPPTRKG